MRFVDEQNKAFLRAKAVTISENYVICASGGQVKIFDKKLNLIHTLENLKSVYNCSVSLDEKRLLLVSVTNCFYVVSLDTLEITKHTIKGKYTDNLEGRGCWTLDSNGCCFCVCDRKNILSALRIYDDINTNQYRELLCDKYWLTSVSVIPKINKYLMTGYDRSKFRSYLIWYDGNALSEFLIQDSSEMGAAVGVRYLEESNRCIVRGNYQTIICEVDGKSVGKVELPQWSCARFSFSNIFENVSNSEEVRRSIASLSKLFGMEDLFVPGQILDMCYSKNGNYLYLATLQGVVCINTVTRAIEATKSFPYGVKKIMELDENLLLLETWDSVELIRVIHENLMPHPSGCGFF